MPNFNEHALEMSIMELFREQGYTYLNGNQIHRERSEVLLLDDIKQFLYNRYSDAGITPSEIDGIILLRNFAPHFLQVISPENSLNVSFRG